MVTASSGIRAEGAVMVTGASGFVGRRLVSKLAAEGFDVVAVSRQRSSESVPGVRFFQADLRAPAQYADLLAEVAVVIHLASATGRVKPREYHDGIVTVTRTLLSACELHGVSRFVYVSSIAATFPDQRHYHYAHAKALAEAAVRSASIPWRIVRPTMILGQDSPIEAALTRLATLPVVPLFGGGRALVQPITVEAVTDALLECAVMPFDGHREVDLAGPDVMTVEALLANLRRQQGLGAARLQVRIPLDALRSVLALIEPLFLPILPFTAGQLAAFANDSIARPGSAFPPSPPRSTAR